MGIQTAINNQCQPDLNPVPLPRPLPLHLPSGYFFPLSASSTPMFLFCIPSDKKQFEESCLSTFSNEGTTSPVLGGLGLWSPSSLAPNPWALSLAQTIATTLLRFLSWHQAWFSAAPVTFALFSPRHYLIMAALFLLGFLCGSYLSSGSLYISFGFASVRF